MKKKRPFHPGEAFKDGKYYKFTKASVTVMRPWGRKAGAWRKTTKKPWHHLRPRIDLNRKIQVKQLSLPGIADRTERKEVAYLRFLACIPQEARSLAARYRHRQWHILQLLNRVPGADDLARSNPALAWMLASSWMFHPVSQHLRAARSLVRKRQREIVGWLCFPRRQSSVKILRKINPLSLYIPALTYLRHFIRRKEVSQALAHLSRINTGVLRLVCDPVLFYLVRPTLLEEVAACSGEDQQPRFALALRDMVRMAVLLDGEQALGHMRPFRSIEAAEASHDELVERLNRKDSSGIAFPEPPLAGTEQIVPLQNHAELVKEGRKMHHCVASYARGVCAGHVYVYRVLAPQRATLAIGKEKGIWKIYQLKGFANRQVSKETWKAVHDWIASSQMGMEMKVLSGLDLDLSVFAGELAQVDEDDPEEILF